MSHKNYTEFHVVISPQDKKNLKKFESLYCDWMEKTCSMWIYSYEGGESKRLTHYDSVIWLEKGRRPDKVRDSINRVLNISPGTPEYRHCVKAYGIDDTDIEWQVGYCRKEKKQHFESDNFNCDLKKCLEIYNKNIKRAEERKEKNTFNKGWSCDTIVEKYIAYLIQEEKKHCPKQWKIFRKEIRDNIKYSTTAKFNMNALNMHLEMYDLEMSFFTDSDVDVLGLKTVDGVTTCAEMKKSEKK